MVIATVSKTFTKVFGSRNERLLKGYHRRVEQINAFEPEIRKLTDPQLRAKTAEFRERIKKGEAASRIQPEVLAAAREAMDRSVGIRNIFDPTLGFDPTRLSADVQPLYHEIAAKIAATAPAPELGCLEPVPGWQQVDIPLALYDAVRVLYPESRRPFRARPFDVQLIGGMVLSEGRISEMKTGEGKTIVAPLACYVACCEGLQCHVVTVNDYLVQRDRDWVFPFYYHTGLTVGAIHPYHMQPPQLKQQMYQCDVVYGTNSELGFDYLRDNMKLTVAEQVQKKREFCIVDEIDSILIDEARTPLIISGPAHDDTPRYGLADQVARHLMDKQRLWSAADEKVKKTQMRIKGLEGDIRNAREKDKVPPMREEMKRLQAELPTFEADRDKHVQYYEVEPEKKAAHLTHDGIAEAQKVANIGSFYVGSNMDFPHLLENALRAHAIYQRDKEYVVQNGEVIIVDEFTGRLMIGRQWSDGLHQAVEAKEKVKIKQETQTLATVTIQNYFKLYKRLAGMTGTAITEGTEFNEIYSLDVVCIPTNVAVIRRDRDDLVFLSQKDKWEAILDEIKSKHDVGRPVLVGTTSVDHSEMLSGMLTRKYAIKHEVLNAKQHEREANIVEHAGELGAVMIATNMAGRGTDIRLAPIDRQAMIRHWQQRNILPREADAALSDQQIVAMSYRHQYGQIFGVRGKELEAMSDADIRLRLLRHWTRQYVPIDDAKIDKLSEEQLLTNLDDVGYPFHRLQPWKHVEDMGGLHIVGTERHEARRIDNQLRGRSGRQGDRGSSRFFIALDDELMKNFAGPVTLRALSKLGMKEGDAIEHPWISKSVERAQRKVEERNYEIRKNLLEYDEVMEYQRNTFYGIRQDVLAGRKIGALVFDYIADAVNDAVDTYLDKEYVQTQVAEWSRQTLQASIEPGRIDIDTLDSLQDQVRAAAREEVRSEIDVTLGEYMSHDLPAEEWDLRGLAHWAMSRFSVDLKQNQLREMNIEQVKSMLTEAAYVQVDRKDLGGLEKFLDPLYAQKDLAEWAKTKFEIELVPEELKKLQPPQAAEEILNRAREAYRRRELKYPVEFVLDAVFQAAQTNGPWAAAQLAAWANQRYEMGWTPEEVAKIPSTQLHDILFKSQQEWLAGGKLEAAVDKGIAEHGQTAESLAEWAQKRFGQEVTAEDLADPAKRRDVVLEKGRNLLRAELTQLERFVLLQILDTAWKDHLYAMDQVKDSVSLRGYAEQDPRIEYKREGANLFRQMQKTARDRVTELIFRARLTAGAPQQTRNVYAAQQAEKAEAPSAVTQAAAAAEQGTDEQREDMEAAERAGAGGGPQSRQQRRAAAAQAADEAAKKTQFKERKRKSR